ncbi:MAG: diguanylate cyclase [Candidatus Omnitrophota bacterium]
MFKLEKYKNLIKIILAVALYISFYSILLYDTKFFSIARLKNLDLFYNLAHQLAPLPRQINDIIVVKIDDESFNKLQKKWPLQRDIYSTLLDRLIPYDPRIVAIDTVFTGESEDKDKDIGLAEAIRKSGNIILSSFIGANKEHVIPLEAIRQDALGFGFINKPRDKDLYVRNARTFYYFEDKNFVDFSFEVKIACAFLKTPLSDITLLKNNVILRKTDPKEKSKIIKIPTGFDGTTAINFRAKAGEFNTIPFWKLVKDDLPENTFRDKLVLVGATAEIFHDVYNTPFGVMPGIFINANDILMILRNDFIKHIPDYISLIISFILGLITCICVYKLSLTKGLILSFSEISLVFTAGFILFLKNFHMDSFSPVFIVMTTCLITDLYKHFNLIIESQILKTQAITDGLTGLFVHRYFKLKLDSEFERVKREEQNLSLIILDIDHFKGVNDSYGHQNGNVVLKHLAQILANTSRKVDVVARYGGEEFCAILPNTNQVGASIYGERLRKAIEAYDFPISQGNLNCTISLGMASFPACGATTSDKLIAFADKALYRAKQTGRNKVCSFDPLLDKTGEKS